MYFRGTSYHHRSSCYPELHWVVPKHKKGTLRENEDDEQYNSWYNIRLPNKNTPRCELFNRVIKEVDFTYDHSSEYFRAKVSDKLFEIIKGVAEVQADKKWFDNAMTMPLDHLRDHLMLWETTMRLKKKI